MPGMNGFELFQKIKHLDDKVKVIFVTAFEESHIEFRRLFPSLEEGDCFIRKPIELHILAEKVKSAASSITDILKHYSQSLIFDRFGSVETIEYYNELG